MEGGILPKTLRKYEREDFSYLLDELRAGSGNESNILQTDSIEESLKENKDNTITLEEMQRRRRASLFDNRKNKYVIDKRKGIIHDRDCELVKDIPDNAFDMSSVLDEEKTICTNCRMNAYIRCGIGDDGKRIGVYHHFLTKVNASVNIIRTLTVENQGKLFMENPDIMRIKVREDSWLVKLHSNGKVTLYHNNYTVLPDDTRFFYEGYHKQIIGAKNNFFNALKIIYGYSWEEHLRAREEKDRLAVAQAQQNQLDVEQHEKHRLINRIAVFYKKIVEHLQHKK